MALNEEQSRQVEAARFRLKNAINHGALGNIADNVLVALAFQVKELDAELCRAKGLLAGALVALGRQGWEDGPTDSEVNWGISNFLGANNEISSAPDGTAVLKSMWELRTEAK